jgi:O-glycosyl hydrolase
MFNVDENKSNMKPLKIYIAGPYSAPTLEEKLENTNKAIMAGIKVLIKGHYPYIPHLTHYVDLFAYEKGIPLKWEDYIDWDLTWLELCDALLFLGDSRGARIELEYAKKLGKYIFYSVDEIPNINPRYYNLKRNKHFLEGFGLKYL